MLSGDGEGMEKEYTCKKDEKRFDDPFKRHKICIIYSKLNGQRDIKQPLKNFLTY